MLLCWQNIMPHCNMSMGPLTKVESGKVEKWQSGKVEKAKCFVDDCVAMEEKACVNLLLDNISLWVKEINNRRSSWLEKIHIILRFLEQFQLKLFLTFMLFWEIGCSLYPNVFWYLFCSVSYLSMCIINNWNRNPFFMYLCVQIYCFNTTSMNISNTSFPSYVNPNRCDFVEYGIVIVVVAAC